MVQIAVWIVLIALNLCFVSCAVVNNTAENVTKAVNNADKQNDAKDIKPVNNLSTTERIESADESKKNVEDKKAENTKPDQQAMPASAEANVYDQVIKKMDIDIEGSVQTGFYILMAISVSALLFVGFKVYKLRLTRAERKYGVQGDHATQELARLPTSMEEPESEEEDQTIFDINREQIRIY